MHRTGKRLGFWRQKDPTCSLLRYEALRLGGNDRAKLAHLAGDPERILEIAADYMRFGLYEDALDVLSRQYPSGSAVVSEPGALHPSSYPLIAYYRGHCRYALGKDGRADFEAGSSMPTRYVFSNRAESFPVLRRAIEVNPDDATAHLLLGSLYLSGGMTGPAMQEWEAVRRILPAIPTLHRNMGYAVLRSGGSPERAIEYFREGMGYDSQNVDLILGLEEAMDKAGRPAIERARTLQGFQGLQSAHSALVFRLVRAQNTLVGAQLRNQSCDGIDAPGFGELDNFPEGGLEPLLRWHGAQNRLHSAVCQGGNLPQAQQSTVGGHERQAKHFCCSGQKAIRWIRMLKRQFLGCNDDFVCQWSLPHVHRCLCHPISDRTVQAYPTLGM